MWRDWPTDFVEFLEYMETAFRRNPVREEERLGIVSFISIAR